MMSKWALIIGNVVHEITTIDPADRFADDMDWRACAEDVDTGWVVTDDGIAAPAQPEINLATLKAALKAEIDAAAERERLRYITPGAGQAMTYARKVEQAKAVLAAVDPAPADYPMLAASIGIDGADIMTVANVIVAMDAAWEAIGAAIEAARLNAKKAVDQAVTAAEAKAVAVIWPS